MDHWWIQHRRWRIWNCKHNVRVGQRTYANHWNSKIIRRKNYFILLQFLIEAIVLCIIGGSFGLGIIYVLTLLISMGTGMDIALSFANIMMGIMISAVVGIISGYIPAYQASQMNPVDAIRSN